MSKISFSGLATGIDIGSMIEQLVAVDSVPITTMKNKQASISNKKSVWNDVNSSLLSLQESLTKVSTSLLNGTYSNSITNENIVSATTSGSNVIPGTYNVKVTQLAQNLVVTGTKFTGQINKEGTVIINDGFKDISIELERTDTVESISKKINNTNSNIKSYVLDGRLVISNKLPGSQNTIKINDSTSIFKDLGIISTDGKLVNITQQAKDAIVSVNGVQVTRSNNSISDLIPGTTLNLKAEGESRVTIEDNVDDIVNNINEFIKTYNATMNVINTKLTEEIPETTTTLNQKQGLLRGNSTLNQIRNKLRQLTLGKNITDSSFDYLYQIGIDSSKDNYGKDGTLQLIDETKLRDAIQNNREDVMKLFIQDTDGDNKISEKDQGLLSYLNNYINDLTSSSSTKKGLLVQTMETLDNSIKDIDKQIERKELQVEARRIRYEKQFTAMETRVSNITSNGEYLINSLAGMLGS